MIALFLCKCLQLLTADAIMIWFIFVFYVAYTVKGWNLRCHEPGCNGGLCSIKLAHSSYNTYRDFGSQDGKAIWWCAMYFVIWCLTAYFRFFIVYAEKFLIMACLMNIFVCFVFYNFVATWLFQSTCLMFIHQNGNVHFFRNANETVVCSLHLFKKKKKLTTSIVFLSRGFLCVQNLRLKIFCLSSWRFLTTSIFLAD